MILAPPMTFKFATSARLKLPALNPLLAACALLMSGCQEGGAPPASETESVPPVAAAEPERPIVHIDVDEYVILMDPVVPAGEVTLQLANLGFEEHNIFFVMLDSDSTIWETERRLSPAERRSVVLDLEPGAYKAVCDFSGHEGRGMFTEFLAEPTSPAEGGGES